jgi:hypothetical protein
MRTAVISDLHLGLCSGGDVLRDPGVHDLLLAELADADRVVLLGDVVELRERPLGAALTAARPFFEALGAALAGREVILVPGNHDHHLAEPLLDELALAGSALGLEQLADPSPGPTATLAGYLGEARLRFAYPGIWLREDVYATHGHYMDSHLRLPRAECIAAAIGARIRGPVPAAATPADYERVLRPIYGLAYAIAQGRRRPVGHQQKAAEIAWETLAGVERARSRGAQLRAAAVRAAFPPGIRGLNRLLHAEFEPDVTGAAIFRGGLAAATELATRLGVDGGHVISGHSHRAGPSEDEESWPLAGGGRLHNTGSWVFSSVFHLPGQPPNAYWPGTLTWVEDEGPPRRTHLLRERSHADLLELVESLSEPGAAPSRS